MWPELGEHGRDGMRGGRRHSASILINNKYTVESCLPKVRGKLSVQSFNYKLLVLHNLVAFIT